MSERAEISSGRPEDEIVTSVVLEMKGAIAQLAGPRCDGDTRESMIARAARRAGISFRQAKAFYYGESRDPKVSGVERVRSALRRKQEAEARAEYRALRDRLAFLEERMAALDEDGTGEMARQAVGPSIGPRGMGSPVD